MTRFKKNYKFRFNANDIEIIDIYESLVLAKIKPDFGRAYYDISSLQPDSNGELQFHPSPEGNGLRPEAVPGGQKEPKSLEEMQQIFDDLVAAATKREIAAAEARDRAEAREKEFLDKKRKGQEAKDHRKALNDQLKALVASSSDLKDFTTSKTVKKIVTEIQLIDLFIANI